MCLLHPNTNEYVCFYSEFHDWNFFFMSCPLLLKCHLFMCFKNVYLIHCGFFSIFFSTKHVYFEEFKFSVVFLMNAVYFRQVKHCELQIWRAVPLYVLVLGFVKNRFEILYPDDLA